MATAIIGLVAAIGVGIFAWQMAKNVGKALTNPLLIIGVIAVIVGYFMIKSKGHQEERPQEERPQEDYE
jgi:flagellar basal body-associated protein FliL